MAPQETPIITSGKAMICRGNPIRLGIIRVGLKGGPTCLPLRSPCPWPLAAAGTTPRGSRSHTGAA